ncbi:MAG: hypothetical protein ABI333_29370 [bacterium]
MALSDAAVAAVWASTLPAGLMQEIAGARAFPEGRPARVTVSNKNKADVVKQLLRIKLAAT